MKTLTRPSTLTDGPLWVHFQGEPHALASPNLLAALRKAEVRGYVAEESCEGIAEVLKQLSLPSAPCVLPSDLPEDATVLRVQ